ncbi:hypothetical protein HYH02_005531 [Chlamydomonas schloesseri]|uniref:Uncharacterized protein n=1 Tax=Chlamydomonas schloesseri TaxID=2026947 RepID=A0A835WKZ1_9CHLO|nr:hypothetical protein HYH02_005531 [Chlamydomonas schloesseri]|eukprot:KAG2449380.1 hypothetical protein HYH02_005531 [Chlamydomonas schloesseri]
MSLCSKSADEVAKHVVTLLAACEDAFDEEWEKVWQYLGEDYRCVGEGYEEVKALLNDEHKALLQKVHEMGQAEGARWAKILNEQRQEEVKQKGTPTSERCKCGGEVYFMGRYSSGPPTGNGCYDADEYKCAGCLREWTGHVNTWHD